MTLVRHDVSGYNTLKAKKDSDPEYQAFRQAYEANPLSKDTRERAEQLKFRFALNVGDNNTALVEDPLHRGVLVGEQLAKTIAIPDIVFVSPYDRTLATLQRLCNGWPELAAVKTVKDERIREQEHGKSLIYNDWRIFFALNPDDCRLRQLEGRYWYRWPNGESVPDVRLRNHDWLGTLTRDYAGQNVVVVTHHLNILATIANLERLDADQFITLDDHDKPINLGVTEYVCDPNRGKRGRLIQRAYNQKFY